MEKPTPFEERYPEEAQLLMDHCQSFNDIDNQEEIHQKHIPMMEYTYQNNRPTPPPTEQSVRDTPKVGRNDPCTCGSGKKYKKCCMN